MGNLRHLDGGHISDKNVETWEDSLIATIARFLIRITYSSTYS